MTSPHVIIRDDNITIVDSWTFSQKEFNSVLDHLRTIYPDNPVFLNRKNCGMSLEWASHNLLYKLGIARSHTKDVDLNYPQKWYVSAAYAVFGVLSWIFV